MNEGATTRGRSSVRQLFVSASATVLLQGGSLAMGFAATVLLARLLGDAGYGRYVFALAWASLLTIPAILGMDRFLVRGLAVYEVRQHWEMMRGLLRRANQFVLLTSVAIMVAGWLVAVIYFLPSMRWPFCLAMILVPLTALTLLRQGAMQAIGRVVSGQVPEFLIRPVLILVGIGVVQLAAPDALTATSAMALNVFAVAVACLIGALLLRRALPEHITSVEPRYAAREWLSASVPMMLISGIWMANNYLTTLMVGILDGSTSAGVYSVVQKGAELIVVLLVATNMPLAPAIARMHEHGDKKGLEHSTERVAQLSLLASAPIALMLILFPDKYLDIFGTGFEGGATALIVLAGAQLVNAAAGPAGNVLLMTGREAIAVRGIVAGLIANVVLCMVLVPQLGVTGGGIAFAASLVLWNVVLMFQARSHVGVNVTAFPILRIVRSSTDSH